MPPRKLTGCAIERAYVDKGYQRAHRPQPIRVASFISGPEGAGASSASSMRENCGRRQLGDRARDRTT